MVGDEKHADVPSGGFLAELSSGERLRTPVNFIVHSQAEVDDALTRRGAVHYGYPDGQGQTALKLESVGRL